MILALGEDQVRALLDVPPTDTLKGTRDRAILAVFLHPGLRRMELIDLRVRDIERGPPTVNQRASREQPMPLLPLD